LQVRFLPGLFSVADRRVALDPLTPLQDTLLKSLFDLLVAVLWACWERLTERRDERLARAAELESRVLPLETRRVMLVETPRPMRVKPRRVRLVNTSFVTVLVSESQMAERVRWAIGERTNLCYVSTWAELQHLVVRVTPSAIIADPCADESGDPARHLVGFASWLRIPVVLYTRLTPRAAAMLVRLGGAGIRHVIFYRYDDAPHRFAAALCCESQGPGPPSRAA
jgi:hypothetical protein